MAEVVLGKGQVIQEAGGGRREGQEGKAVQQVSSRLLSLDLVRGFIMVLLALESTGLYEYLLEATKGTGLWLLVLQLHHHPWNGLRFWDLIQPGFMYVAGVALAFSLHKQWSHGVGWKQSFTKVLKRSAWLFFFGVLDYAVRPNGLSFELWNVLTQLAFTTLVAFLIFRWSMAAQIGVCAGLLLLTEALYRFTHIPGFDQPFTDQHNFGNYVDLLLMNKINEGGWVAINCVPTAVHTIGGALTGKLLLGGYRGKVKIMLVTAALCLIAGYGLDAIGITPIIKRISTTSFVLASLGWCLAGFALSYWWIDLRHHRRHLEFFTIVGMNSIFIYLFFEIVGVRWFNGYVSAIVGGLLGMAGSPQLWGSIISALVIFALEWGLCYFLYKKKVFFKL